MKRERGRVGVTAYLLCQQLLCWLVAAQLLSWLVAVHFLVALPSTMKIIISN